MEHASFYSSDLSRSLYASKANTSFDAASLCARVMGGASTVAIGNGGIRHDGSFEANTNGDGYVFVGLPASLCHLGAVRFGACRSWCDEVGGSKHRGGIMLAMDKVAMELLSTKPAHKVMIGDPKVCTFLTIKVLSLNNKRVWHHVVIGRAA